MRLLVALLTLTCVALGYAQVPLRCTTPDTWEARTYETNSASSYSRFGRRFYDAVNERIAFEEQTFVGDTETSATDEYLFYKLKYGYHFNRMTRQCTRFSMNRTFVKFGVPATALFIDTYVIGSNADPQYGVTVNAWADNYGADGRRVFEFVANGDCIPVSIAEFGGVPGSVGFNQQSFYDVVAGVNPDHFIPPEECQ